MRYEEFTRLLRGVKGKTARCPAHDDRQNSLSHSLKNGKILVHCHAGCSTEEILSAMGLEMTDLFEEEGNQKMNIVATYDYCGEKKKLLYQAVRLVPKSFRQRRPDGNGGWVWNMKGIQPIPYRLPELLEALKNGKVVFVVEGEKDADNLAALGVTATTNHGGAGKWQASHSGYFPAGAKVIILPDNDPPGRQHAFTIANQLTNRGVKVKVLGLPGLSEKGDVSDWLTAGGTKEELFKLAAEAKTWETKEESNEPEPEPEQEETQKKEIHFVCMANVEPEEVCFLWEPYIPLRKITLMEGDPAAGKTWLALAIASAVSTGAPFPDPNHGRCIYHREPANVIYLSAEDGVADTLRPRLDMMEANVENIYTVIGTCEQGEEGLFSFSDIGLLDGLAASLRPALIVIDPLQAYLGAGVDMHRANETRPVLAKLAALAERHKCAVLVLRHLSKAVATKNIYRGMGSIDFTAAARSVLLAGCDPQDAKRRAIVQIKSSLAPTGAAQGYELKDGFYWMGISELTANQILGSEKETEKTDKLQEAKDFLTDILKDGPVRKRDIEELAKGISNVTLRRASNELGIKSYKKPGAKHGYYLWEFPGNNFQPQVAHDEQAVNTSLGYTMINPTTREKASNDAASTGCSRKNDDQPVEVNGDKAYSDSHGLIKEYPRGKTEKTSNEQPVNSPPEYTINGNTVTTKEGYVFELGDIDFLKEASK